MKKNNNIPSLNNSDVESITNAIENAYFDKTDKELKVSVITSAPKPKNKIQYTVLFQAVNVVLSRNLKPLTCKLLLYLIAKTEFSNHVGVNIETMAEELNYSVRNVARSLSELKQYNVIHSYQDPQDSRRNIYIINPNQSWKGSYKEFVNVKKVLGNKLQLRLPFDEGK